MSEKVIIESSYETYYHTEVTLPEGKTKDDIRNIVHKWSDIWIEWKDSKEDGSDAWHAGEQSYDMETVDDGKYPYRINVLDDEYNTVWEGWG